MVLLFRFILYFIIFALYLELNPSLGNIWYRIGEDGMRHIQLVNLLYFIIEPLKNRFLWNLEFLDLNFFVGALLILITS